MRRTNRRIAVTRAGVHSAAKIALALLAGLPLAAAQVTYSWTTIDTSSLTPYGTLHAEGGISPSGNQVVGDLRGGGGDVAFLANGLAVQSLGSLGGTPNYSDAAGVDASGEVVGTSQTAGGASQAFTWTSGSGMQELVPSSQNSWATAINSSGDITGYAYFATGTSGAFFWSPSGGLQMIGADVGQGLAINDSGEVAGSTSYGSGDAFTWTSGGGVVDLGTMFGWGSSRGRAINDLGQVAGEYYTTPGSTYTAQAYVYTPGSGYITLTNGIPFGINDSGVVVGDSFDFAASGSGCYGNVCAFVYLPGSGTSFLNNDLATPYHGAGSYLEDAIAVNNAGDILAIDNNGNYVVLDPLEATPEPGTLGSGVLAVLVAAWAARRHLRLARRRYRL
jgi:probable HAF family extracellular repeat protein